MPRGLPPLDTPAGASTVALPLLLSQVAVILMVVHSVRSLLGWLGQPYVVGEMAAGILLGPSLLGIVAPGLSATLFAPTRLGGIETLSHLGTILFMFAVGLEVDP